MSGKSLMTLSFPNPKTVSFPKSSKESKCHSQGMKVEELYKMKALTLIS